MQAFNFHTPTEIVFGMGSEFRVGDLVKKHGGNNVLIVYGRESIVKSGLLAKITENLKSLGLNYVEYGGAMPNPSLEFARIGVQTAIKNNIDFILAVGGGSAIDAAKAIAHGTKNPDIDIWRFWLREVVLESSLPVGVVLTISAAGSETSMSAVLTNTETGEKRGLGTEFNRPRFAIMNPELTFSLPKYHIACGIADILMHTLDRYFAPEANNELTDEIAEALLRVVIKNGLAVMENPSDYQAQSELMWCGSLSHNGITGLGREMDFSVHGLGHELSGRFNVAHGASLTTMWGSWARYCLHVNPKRFLRYAEKVWGVQSEELGISKTEEFFKKIGMPTCFTELGIGVQPDDIIQKLAHGAVFYGKRLVGTFKPLNEQDCYNIYILANR